jgi:hypothetical protein
MENKIWNRKSSMHKVLIAGLVLISLSFIFFTQSCKASVTTPPPATTIPAPSGIRVEIIEHNMSVTESGVPTVTGIIQPVVSYPLSGAEVWVKFYDAAGELLGTSNDLTNNDILPGDTWTFVIIYFGPNPENVDSYEVEIGFPNY